MWWRHPLGATAAKGLLPFNKAQDDDPVSMARAIGYRWSEDKESEDGRKGSSSFKPWIKAPVPATNEQVHNANRSMRMHGVFPSSGHVMMERRTLLLLHTHYLWLEDRQAASHTPPSFAAGPL